MSDSIIVNRLAGSLGAELTGFKLNDLSDENMGRVKELLLKHQVLFFPEQFLSIDEHVDFGSWFGPLESHPNLDNPFTHHPQVFELAASHGGLADEWHSDLSFQSEPAVASILNMVECPDVGGDTLWTSTYTAFEALSEPMQELCCGLTALHDAAPHGTPDVTAIHPVVRIHPETGRKALFVNEHFTRRVVELSYEESRVLLDYLFSWIAKPRFTVRYRWRKGTIAIWDNRCTQHFVLSDFVQQRIIQRVTVIGDQPSSDSAPRWEPFIRTENQGATSRYDAQLNRHLGRHAVMLESNAKRSSNEKT
ncbi:MAG: TauD/TfdA family dioxygenase [Acidiferrobacterales bacterium]|nr:TauD/TfdA family dioxygenase [Acidiferrobacterales bacterium]